MSETIDNKLVQEIRRAFANTHYPGDDKLIEYPFHSEAPDLIRHFKGRHWKAIPPEVLFEERHSLSLFTPEAFRFYLPAYLIASELYPVEVDTLPENTFYMLTPPEAEGPKMDRFLARVAGFTPQQKAVILAFVKSFAESEPFYPEQDRERATRFWEAI